MQYKQLNSEQRYTIEKLLHSGVSKTQIASIIGVHRSTIGRELKRNTPVEGCIYYSSAASYMSESRRKKANQRPYKLTEQMKEDIEACLKKGWSPEQIVGRYALKGKEMVSHETIYNYIYEHPEKALHKYLRRGKRKRQKRGQKYKKRGVLLNRVSIEERPTVVEEQSRYGDWEGDTIVGKGHKSYVITLTERKSNFNLISSIPSKNSKFCAEKMIELLEPFKPIVHSLTLDNGKEFAQHERITAAIAQVYFAHPYSSFERGCNENQNGLIRQYLKKGSCFLDVSAEEILEIQRKLNERPSKKLNFRTPQEVMDKLLNSVAVQI